VAGGGGRRTAAVFGRGWNATTRVVANICKGKLILYFANIQFFEINECQMMSGIHHPHPRRSHIYHIPVGHSSHFFAFSFFFFLLSYFQKLNG
jgi:hypothetical protein